MKILKGYVFRLYPNKNQEELINKTIGCSRFIYNYFLADHIKKLRKSKTTYEQIKQIPSLIKDYRAPRINLFNAYNRFKNKNVDVFKMS